MPKPKIVFHETFVEQNDKIPKPVSDDMARIIKALRDDPWYRPEPQEYVFEYRAKEELCACQRYAVEPWEGWVLLWSFGRTLSLRPDYAIDFIQIMVDFNPPLQLKPRWVP